MGLCIGGALTRAACYAHAEQLAITLHSSLLPAPASMAAPTSCAAPWRPVSAVPPGDRPRPAAAVSATPWPCRAGGDGDSTVAEGHSARLALRKEELVRTVCSLHLCPAPAPGCPHPARPRLMQGAPPAPPGPRPPPAQAATHPARSAPAPGRAAGCSCRHAGAAASRSRPAQRP